MWKYCIVHTANQTTFLSPAVSLSSLVHRKIFASVIIRSNRFQLFFLFFLTNSERGNFLARLGHTGCCKIMCMLQTKYNIMPTMFLQNQYPNCSSCVCCLIVSSSDPALERVWYTMIASWGTQSHVIGTTHHFANTMHYPLALLWSNRWLYIVQCHI